MADSVAKLGSEEQERLDRLIVDGGELLKHNRVTEARQSFTEALALDPNNIKALGLMGLVCFRMNDFHSALPVYERLVSIRKGDASFALNLGLVYLRLGQAAEAIVQLRRCRELDPSQTRAVSYLGLAHARNGEYAEAYQAFLQAGEDDLADEMAQYLTEEQRIELQSAVVGQAGVSPNQLADRSSDSVMFSTQGTVELRDDDVDLVIDEEPVEDRSSAAAPVETAGEKPGETAGAGSDDDASVHEFSLDDALDNALGGDNPAATAESSGSVAPETSAAPDERADVESPSGPTSTPASSAIPRRREKGPGAISQAVALAVPSSAAATGAARVGAGNEPPKALFEFATDKLIRPDDGDSVFELTAAGVLIVRVAGRIYTRTEGVNVTGGELAYEVAARRARGSSGGEEFSSDGRPLFVVSGQGHMLASPLDEHFTAVTLDQDILYLREDLVFAFEDQLRWENGHVPGSNATIRMVQFRGQGSVAFRSRRPLLAIKLASERVLHVDAQVLAGWIGRVIPRAVTPAAGGETSTLFVECTGEGVILVEDEGEGGAPNATDSARPVLAGARRVESNS